jgi:hypothetical protein
VNGRETGAHLRMAQSAASREMEPPRLRVAQSVSDDVRPREGVNGRETGAHLRIAQNAASREMEPPRLRAAQSVSDDVCLRESGTIRRQTG